MCNGLTGLMAMTAYDNSEMCQTESFSGVAHSQFSIFTLASCLVSGFL